MAKFPSVRAAWGDGADRCGAVELRERPWRQGRAGSDRRNQAANDDGQTRGIIRIQVRFAVDAPLRRNQAATSRWQSDGIEFIIGARLNTRGRFLHCSVL